MKRQNSATIGDLKKHGKRLVFDYGVCKTIRYLPPGDIFLKDSVQLDAMMHFYPCPTGGHCNGRVVRGR